MAYTSNPYAKKARRLAVNDVLSGRYTQAGAARKYGVVESTISKWMRRAPRHNNQMIDTRSAAPHHHPNQLDPAIVVRIIQLRKQLRNRCAPVIHAHLRREHMTVSLSSVERTLRREHLTRKRRRASWYTPLPRPLALHPGTLVQMDTIHYVRPDKSRFYVYTLIDVYSRLAYAEYHQHLSQRISFDVMLRAQELFGFHFHMIQTDNGPEFKDWLQGALSSAGIKIRHSRVRKPNDNAHIERFNRTLQEECFHGRLPNETTMSDELKTYLDYYNYDRLHLSLNLLTPTQFLSKVLT